MYIAGLPASRPQQVAPLGESEAEEQQQMSEVVEGGGGPAGPRWQPLGPVERRVLGVLVEKAKTTPDAYPMTLNALVAGCNQKSNRHPLMQLGPEDVEQALDRLRQLGAAGIVQGLGRVDKYRHYFYEWLGVDKVEAAVMAELLLRGAQTEGELRAHVSRMEPVADLPALRQVLAALHAKGLVVPLTPPGRGHLVAHALYLPQELERLRTEYSGKARRPESPVPADTPPAVSSAASPAPAGPSAADREAVEALRAAVDELQAQLLRLQHEVEELGGSLRGTQAELERLRAELGA